MIDFWSIVRFLHVTGAVVWVGGQLALSLVVRPAAVRTLDDESRYEFFVDAGRLFGRISTYALAPLLLATGLALIYHRGVTIGGLSQPGYGVILAVKIVLALVSFAIAAFHGMLSSRGTPGTARAVGITGGLVSLGIVLLATALVP